MTSSVLITQRNTRTIPTVSVGNRGNWRRLPNRYRTLRRLVCLLKTGEHASVYWWKDWDVETNAKGQRRRLVTFYGIRFHDEGKEGEIVYTTFLVNSVLLKDKKPGLKEFSKNWFKGKEGKARKKEAKEDGDGTWMLDMYDAYLQKKGEKSQSDCIMAAKTII